jgi:hypothetical protein
VLAEAEQLATRIAEGSPLAAHTGPSSDKESALVESRGAVSVSSLKSVRTPSAETLADRIKLNEELMALDGNVAIALAALKESGATDGAWLECDERLIAHLCGGKFPHNGYMIYKNVRLCKAGMAEEIAKTERLTIEQIMFPKDGEMMIGQAK